MSVRYVNDFELNVIWPQIKGFIDAALVFARGEINADQVRYAVVKRIAELFITEKDGKVTGAVVVEFINYPNYRVANIIATGGKGVMENLTDFKALLKVGGASYIDSHVRDSMAKMLAKHGMKKIYTAMRCEV